jgi:4-carboxymuconolactone decarboxylase
MPRIPLLNDRETLTEAQRAIFDAVVSGPRGIVQGPLMAALHSPDLAERWHRIGEFVRYRTSLPPKLSEVAILVTARAWSCQLEWFLHAPIAEKAGVPADVIAAIRDGKAPPDDDIDLMHVYDYAKELQTTRFVSDTTHARILERWGVQGTVELTAVVGYYTMVAMMLNSQEFPLPGGATAPLAPLD